MSRGLAERRLMTGGGREIRLRRSYAQCSSCGLELLPLDEELGLLAQGYTPRLVGLIARLGAAVPFAAAQEQALAAASRHD